MRLTHWKNQQNQKEMQKEKTLTFQNAKKLKGRQKVLNDLGEKSFQ